MTESNFNSFLVIGATAVALLILFHPRILQSKTWRATVTPLASIIGSGFLILAPILKHSFGVWGIVVMFGLCLAAYLLGGAIRFNIVSYENLRGASSVTPKPIARLETIASYALALAYIISITYYLNLFGAFAISMTPAGDQIGRVVTSGTLGFIAAFGWVQGFSALERIEKGTVGLKLGIIAGLLVALFAFFIEQVIGGQLPENPAQGFKWQSVTVALGLVITVQGFETSRYLGNEYDAATRIRTMKLSQWIATGIYMIFIILSTICFTAAQIPNTETGVIGMTLMVAPVLPAMLVAAALAAQFSAAVADTGGCGGLTEEVTKSRIKAKVSYLIIGVIGITLTWLADIYTIIAYASRAFAIYYCLQCAIASRFALRLPSGSIARSTYYAVLALFAAAVVIFGRPAE